MRPAWVAGVAILMILVLIGCREEAGVFCAPGGCGTGGGPGAGGSDRVPDGGSGGGECPGCGTARCGDGIVDPPEECDDGEANAGTPGACRADCTLPRCGDGVVDPGEICDDGNLLDGDGCESTCRRPVVVQIAAGVSANCALFDTGRVRCWGNGVDGNGAAQAVGDDEPAGAYGDLVLGGLATKLSLGLTHSCALLENGEVRCWGRGDSGELGLDDVDAYLSVVGDHPGEMPPPVLPAGEPVTDVFTGRSITCIRHENGDVRCWGQPELLPVRSVEDVDLYGKVVHIAFGYAHACALFDEGNVRCWGDRSGTYLGSGQVPPHSLEDAGDVDLGGPAVQIDSSWNHTCAVLANGDVVCWGMGGNTGAALGYENGEFVGDDETPREAGPVRLGAPALQVTTGHYHTCALLVGGRVKCWGRLEDGALGYGARFPRRGPDGETLAIGDEPGDMPPPDVDVGGRVVQIVARGDHTCALLEHGGVRCWGGSWFAFLLGYGREMDLDQTPATYGDVPLLP